MVNICNIEIMINLIKILFISFNTYFFSLKIISDNKYWEKNKILAYISILILPIITLGIRNRTNFSASIIFLTCMLSYVFAITTNSNFGYSITINIISMAFNYILYIIATTITYFLNIVIKLDNDLLILFFIIVIYTLILLKITKIKRFKYGIPFLKKGVKNEYIDMLITNISSIVILSIIILVNFDIRIAMDLTPALIMFAIIMFITIQKSLQLYYKQKLLVQELEQTKQELAEKTKEVKELEAENIKISKNAHTLTHKQKSLEHKIEEMMMKAEISKEEAAEVRDRLNGIAKDLYKEKTTIELDKTGIAEIDDMLKYMQSECKKNKIDFELQLKGNIHHMTNNLIEKKDLETLLADHIKNAIIAINHTDNINRSILVRLGKIEETYGLYIYDSGIEFGAETLENLGKKPSTTHADEGGTGMGFMNTFDTLRKCRASLIIEEYNEPSKDNYTKALLIKFDNKNEFKIKSYRQNEK